MDGDTILWATLPHFVLQLIVALTDAAPSIILAVSDKSKAKYFMANLKVVYYLPNDEVRSQPHLMVQQNANMPRFRYRESKTGINIMIVAAYLSDSPQNGLAAFYDF